MRKFLSKAIVLCTIFIMLFPLSVLADNGKYMSFSIDIGPKGGWVDGSTGGPNHEGIYYHLTPGKISVQDFSYYSKVGTGEVTGVELKRERFGPDRSYGTISPSSTMVWDIDTDSDKYYFVIYASTSTTLATVDGDGYVHDHRP